MERIITFAERLKIAIEKRGLSQAGAARQCGVSQQAMNYIINNKLSSSKLGPQIASSLGINPDWLIYGRGKFEETKICELPIIHSLYMLKQLLKQEIDKNLLAYTTVDKDLGPEAFAFLLQSRQMILCYGSDNIISKQYLTITDTTFSVTDHSTSEKGERSFPIFEWRVRYVDF